MSEFKSRRDDGKRRSVAERAENAETEKTPLLWSSREDCYQQNSVEKVAASSQQQQQERHTFEEKFRATSPVLMGEDPLSEQTEPKKRCESDIVRENLDRMDKDSDEGDSLWRMPANSSIKQIWWVLTWPSAFLLFLTVPDCRKPHLRKYFIVTFIMSVLWIAGLSYLCVWMVTIIAYTLYIPDTVAGITLLAVGTSIPEVISSVIVVRNGLGNMAICNLLGSNIFDILFCLGAPWLVKSAMNEGGTVVINSSALTYTTATLLTTVLMLYTTFYFSKWNLNGTVGITCFILYVAFLVLACMYELNVFGDINPPSCPRLD